MNWREYDLTPITIVIQPLETYQTSIVGIVLLLDSPEKLSVESYLGYYEKGSRSVRQLQEEHAVSLTIRNKARYVQEVKFLQGIQRNLP